MDELFEGVDPKACLLFGHISLGRKKEQSNRNYFYKRFIINTKID